MNNPGSQPDTPNMGGAGTKQGEAHFPNESVKTAVEQYLSRWEWSMENDIHDNLEKAILYFWLSSTLKSVFWWFQGSKYELSELVSSTVVQSVQDMQTELQKNEGFFQVREDFWRKLMDMANDENRDQKEQLAAAIQLVVIVDFFTVLLGKHGHIPKGKQGADILFSGFLVSDVPENTWDQLARKLSNGVHTSISTVDWVVKYFLQRKHTKDAQRAKDTRRMEKNFADQEFAEQTRQCSAFSEYNLAEKALFFSPELLDMLGYTKEEVFAHQAKMEEVVTLFYPDPEERERIDSKLSKLKKEGLAYEATFFPRRKDGKKIAVHFHTVPMRNPEGEIIGTRRFAKNVTMDDRDNIDLLTGESDKRGFEVGFHNFLTTKISERRENKEHTGRLSVAYLDLDRFKTINDVYDHDNADIILHEFAKMARWFFRKDDVIARLWWDEFGIICDDFNKEQMLKKLDRLRDTFSRSTFEIASKALIPWGLIVHESYEEAVVYQNKRNTEIRQYIEGQKDADGEAFIYDIASHCCIGAVGISCGVTDFAYRENPFDEQTIPQILLTLKGQADRVMKLIKNLDILDVGASISRNGTGMPVFNTAWQMVGAEILSRVGKFTIDRQALRHSSVLIKGNVENNEQHR